MQSHTLPSVHEAMSHGAAAYATACYASAFASTHTHTRLLRATHPASHALTAASEHVEGQHLEEPLAELVPSREQPQSM